MSIQELIEKQLPKWRMEFRSQIREQLTEFAIELLELVKKDFNTAWDEEAKRVGEFRPVEVEAVAFIDKALEELRK